MTGYGIINSIKVVFIDHPKPSGKYDMTIKLRKEMENVCHKLIWNVHSRHPHPNEFN